MYCVINQKLKVMFVMTDNLFFFSFLIYCTVFYQVVAGVLETSVKYVQYTLLAAFT